MFYKVKKNRNNVRLWLSAVNPPFSIDESEVVALDDEIIKFAFNNELSNEFTGEVDEEEYEKTKEI